MDERGHRRWAGRPVWVDRLGGGGVPEAVAAALMFLYSVVIPAGTFSVTVLALDAVTFLLAGAVGRLPVAGTVGTLLGMAMVPLVSPDLISWGLFACCIPLVSTGARRLWRLQSLAALAFLVVTIAITVPLVSGPRDVVATVLVWSVFIGLAWLTGRVLGRLNDRSAAADARRTQALRAQRRSIARDLHDTVAYSTSTMVMRAEQMKLRTTDPDDLDDLEFIVATGRRSIRDLRAMMATLRRNDPDGADEVAPWRVPPLEQAIEARERELSAHGFCLTTSIDADLGALPASVREALAKVVVEATANMVKHAGPGECRLLIEATPHVVEAVFTNPLRPEHARRPGDGLGLVGAAERVEALGGDLEAIQGPDTWILRVLIPVEG